MAIIEVKNLSYIYNEGSDDQAVAVKNVSFEIQEGEFVVLLGHNGSGKSTLAKIFNGLLEPTSGACISNGLDTSKYENLFEIRKNVGVVFQNPDNQMVAAIIEDDIAFGPENLGLPPKEIDERIDWALECVGMSGHRKGTPFRLSGGQKQRIAIAGVLALKPKVLVLDEATSMLDPQGRKSVLNVLQQINKNQNITIVLITHFMEEAVAADRIIIMDNGEIVYNGGKEIFEQEDRVISYGLDLPVASSIAAELNRNGLSLKNVYTEEDLAEALCPSK